MTMGKGYALARAELIRALTAYSGIATDDGAVDGTTIIDSNLIYRNDFITEKTILIMSGDAQYESRGALSFDNTTGTITVISAFIDSIGAPVQIMAGTIYRVLNIPSADMVLGPVAAIEAKLDDATTGLAAIKDLIDALEVKLDDPATGLEALKDLIDAVEAKLDKTLFPMEFWSLPKEEVQIGNGVAGATVTLPTVEVADLPASVVVVRAVALFFFRIIDNVNAGANKLNGATDPATSQVIQIRDDGGGDWIDAINFVDDQFSIEATTREGGTILVGSINISGSGKVDGNDIYEFRWLLARADLDYLQFNDVQVGIRVWYTV